GGAIRPCPASARGVPATHRRASPPRHDARTSYAPWRSVFQSCAFAHDSKSWKATSGNSRRSAARSTVSLASIVRFRRPPWRRLGRRKTDPFDVNPHRFVSLLESDDEKSFEQTQSRFTFSTPFAEGSDINGGRA